jgi:hypothetical protein
VDSLLTWHSCRRYSENSGTVHFAGTVYPCEDNVTFKRAPRELGSIDLAHPYSYDGIAYLEHMMLLSPGGQPLDLYMPWIGRSLSYTAASCRRYSENSGTVHFAGTVYPCEDNVTFKSLSWKHRLGSSVQLRRYRIS